MVKSHLLRPVGTCGEKQKTCDPDEGESGWGGAKFFFGRTMLPRSWTKVCYSYNRFYSFVCVSCNMNVSPQKILHRLWDMKMLRSIVTAKKSANVFSTFSVIETVKQNKSHWLHWPSDAESWPMCFAMLRTANPNFVLHGQALFQDGTWSDLTSRIQNENHRSLVHLFDVVRRRTHNCPSVKAAKVGPRCFKKHSTNISSKVYRKVLMMC